MRTLLALAVCAGLAGCASSVDGPLGPEFGMALASMDSQIIDPTPADGPTELSPRAAELALRRYQEHRIIEPIGAYDSTIFQRSGTADDAAASSRTPGAGKAEGGGPPK